MSPKEIFDESQIRAIEEHVQQKQRRLLVDAHAAEFIENHTANDREGRFTAETLTFIRQITDTQPPCEESSDGTCRIRVLYPGKSEEDKYLDLFALQFLAADPEVFNPLPTKDGGTVYEFMQIFPDNSIQSVFVRRHELKDEHGDIVVEYNSRNTQHAQITEDIDAHGLDEDQARQLFGLKLYPAAFIFDAVSAGIEIANDGVRTAARQTLGRIGIHGN